MRSLGRLLTCPEIRQTKRLLVVQHRCATSGSSSASTRRIGQEATALDVLKNSRQGAVQFVHESESVMDAIRTMVDNEVGSLVVQDGGERVVGFLTGRDMLRTVVTKGKLSEYGTEPEGWNVPVSSVMTPATELIFLSPTDTLDDARSLMAVSGKRHMPVLSGETLMGIINPKDIASYLHHHVLGEASAKEDYVSRVMPRRGMPTGVRVNRADAQPFALQSAVCNLPHPSKVEAGGEDAYLLGPDMVGVADGVGSWWEGGINPADYARSLMHACRHSCARMKAELELHPQQVLQRAWSEVERSRLVGSSTACLVALHPHKAELRAANVGDSGFLILRRNVNLGDASRLLGTLDAMAAYSPGRGAASDGSEYHVAFRSPQQLRAFNAPYQLGRAPDAPDDTGLDDRPVPDERFETPNDASKVRVPVKSGDVVVLATDGLFDNMPEQEVLDILAACGPGAPVEELARRLAHRAQELSLDNETDSPFAILAKDNDICWGGGRPDDITVIVSRVIDPTEEEPPQSFSAFTGPGTPPPAITELPALQDSFTPLHQSSQS